MQDEIVRLSPTFYGITMVPEDSWKAYGFALLCIAGSDGVVSDPEMEWLTIDLAQAVGVNDEIIGSWEDFDHETADLEEIFQSFNTKSFANFNKLLIYDAIRMAIADGDYAEEEKESVNEAAQILKVSREAVISIEALVELEMAANKLRLTVL